MQVDPIKPTLKAPGTKHLKLEYDELPSTVAFKLNLRRYTKERHLDLRIIAALCALWVRRCRLTLSNPR